MTIQEALDYCLANPEGLSAQELLARFPEYREELVSLLGLASGISSLAVPTVPADRREDMKSRLMATAAEKHAQTTVEASTASTASTAIATSSAPVPVPVPVPVSISSGRQRKPLPWFLSPGWIVAAAAVLLVAFTWWVSANSLPDSPVYTIKLASENIGLSLISSDDGKVQEHIDLAISRLDDLRTMEKRSALAQAQAAFVNYSSHLDSAQKLWKQLTKQPNIGVTKSLYLVSAAGALNFKDFASLASSLPADIQNDISQTNAQITTALGDTDAALRAAGVNPTDVIAGADSSMASLFTPVTSVAIAVPTDTLTVPVVAISPTTVAVVPPIAMSPTVAVASTSTLYPPTGSATSTSSVSVPVPNTTVTAIPSASPTLVLGLKLTRTSTPLVSATARATSTPTTATTIFTPAPTSTTQLPPQETAIVTATLVEPGPTETPPLGTPTGIPTNVSGIPADTPTDTPIPQPGLPTNTPVPPATPVPPVGTSPTSTPVSVIPTDTSVPASNPTSTPVPPSFTPVPSSPTPVPPSPTPHPPTPTPTNIPPSATPVPQGDVCDLQISSHIAASCASASSVTWSATISNPGPGVVHATYKAELLVMMQGGGGFQSVKTVSGSRDFSPGDTPITGTISYNFPANARQWRVRVSIDTSGHSCNIASHQSNPMDVCP